jgi:hypothetical protein
MIVTNEKTGIQTVAVGDYAGFTMSPILIRADTMPPWKAPPPVLPFRASFL